MRACRILAIIVFLAGSTISGFAQTANVPLRSIIDPGIVTTRQQITPAGTLMVFAGRVYGVAFGASDAEVYVVSGADKSPLYQIDWRQNRIERIFHSEARAGMQGIVWDAASRKIVISAVQTMTRNGKRQQEVLLMSPSNGELTTIVDGLGLYAAGGVSIANDRRRGIASLTFNNELAVVDLESGKLAGKAKVGIAPFTGVVDHAGNVAYVSNWGGRIAKPGEKTAQTGHEDSTDQVVVDERGIASTGTISRVDLGALKTTDTISVGLHPTALAWDEAHARLYVANNNSDSISVIDTARNAVIQTIPLQPFQTSIHGVAPTALALDATNRRLYVACGGINAVAVIRLESSAIEGLIPTGWYPDHLALSREGKSLAIASFLGVGSGTELSESTLKYFREGLPELVPGLNRRYVHSNRGSVQVVTIPDNAQLANYTTAVAENNHLHLRGEGPAAPAVTTKTSVAPLPVPARAGDPAAIEHVVYIIKENRTYDQLLGDIAKGNGDPSLTLYGRDVSANHHKLAEDFVLLDNFYATGGNSGDGHQWVTQAAETAYCYWPGYAGRSYPFDGDDPIAPAASGFIWDAALARKKTVEIFGEYAGMNGLPLNGRSTLLNQWKQGESFTGKFQTVAPNASVNKLLAADYPAYSGSVPDVVRARIFLNHLAQWNKAGQMPNLVLIQLPSDHTGGTSPGYSTPKAAVADNDLALGQIVEGLSHSQFWKKMAIFVVEDDAQDGVDHVDGHRTVALAISPYTRRGSVDSTFYSQPSMLKTIELMLGLPTLSLFDLIANDMRNSFQSEPDFKPYEAVNPVQSLFEVNPPASSLQGEQRRAANDSAKMNFREPDAAPSDKLNRILWHDIKGWSMPYPAKIQSVFAPFALDQNDDEKEKRKPIKRGLEK
jgi:YVTN family beta-propeller protein